jgi:3-oxoacyl-[acyl-carrier-protein] synthase I
MGDDLAMDSLGPTLAAAEPRPAPMVPVALAACALVSAAGTGLDTLATALALGRSPLQPNARSRTPLKAWVGEAPGLDDTPLPSPWAGWDCRATRLAWAGLQADGFAAQVAAAVQAHGATRVGLVLGTSASTIAVSEQAYRALAPDGGFPAPLRSTTLNHIHAVTAFVQQALALQGPAVTVSTACSSSAKAFAQAERWLRLGLVDAVVVGGVDALCDSVLFGFAALGLVSTQPCTPFGSGRQGISIGEAAGFVLLQRAQACPGAVRLLGHGEANDAHHMSSPHPEGAGAERALDAALARAGLHAHAVDYLNLHGTATPANDAVEAALVARRYRADVHASATKGSTGHAMGAAGIVEALACVLALQRGLCSGTAHTAAVDPALGTRFAAQLRLAPAERAVRVAASHSFGFGGNNAVLLFGAAA